MPQETMNFNLPMIHVGNYCFNLLHLVAIDRSEYFLAGLANRKIVLHLQYGITHTFNGDDAHTFNQWFLTAFSPM